MKRALILLTALIWLGTPGFANAAPQNSVLSGLSVVWNGLNNLAIQPGEGYIGGFPWVPLAAVPLAFAPGNLQNGQLPLTANTPYYIYACLNGGVVSQVISKTSPTNDGVGHGILTPGGGVCTALFLGSVVTDSLVNLVPFVRTGEEVILNLVNYNCLANSIILGAGYTSANITSVTGTCVPLRFDSNGADDSSCNQVDSAGNPLVLPYPASASAALIDFLSFDSDGLQYALFVSPQVPNPAGPIATSNSQFNFLATAKAIGYYSHARINPTVIPAINVGNHPPPPPTSATFSVCANATPAIGQTLTVEAFYRGYVESIGHLTQG